MPKPHVKRRTEVGKTAAQVDAMRQEREPPKTRTWHLQQEQRNARQGKHKEIVSVEYELHVALRNILCHQCDRVILKGEQYSRATTRNQQKVSICKRCQDIPPKVTTNTASDGGLRLREAGI